MQQQFLALRERYQVTSVFVTHDLLEALLWRRASPCSGWASGGLIEPGEFFGLTTPTARAFLETLPPALLEGPARDSGPPT